MKKQYIEKDEYDMFIEHFNRQVRKANISRNDMLEKFSLLNKQMEYQTWVIIILMFLVFISFLV